MSDETALQRLVDEDAVPEILADLSELVSSDVTEPPYEISFRFREDGAKLIREELEEMGNG